MKTMTYKIGFVAGVILGLIIALTVTKAHAMSLGWDRTGNEYEDPYPRSLHDRFLPGRIWTEYYEGPAVLMDDKGWTFIMGDLYGNKYYPFDTSYYSWYEEIDPDQRTRVESHCGIADCVVKFNWDKFWLLDGEGKKIWKYNKIVDPEWGDFHLTTSTGATLSGIHINYHDEDVSAVPIPASAWLFASGLLGFLSIARKRASQFPRVNGPAEILSLIHI